MKNFKFKKKIKEFFKFAFKNSKKGAIELNMLGYLIIAIVGMVLLFVGYLILSGKMSGAINHIKNIFRFGM